MLDDENTEHFPELLRERRRHFSETGREIDFWVVPNPTFLDQMPDEDKRIKKPAAALVSTDKNWIVFMKLRMDRVLKGELKGKPSQVLQSKGKIQPYEPPSPDKWTAPYSKYASGWWERFEPPQLRQGE